MVYNVSRKEMEDMDSIEYEEYIGNRLKQLRGQKHVAARRMSTELGQNNTYINRIERHKAFPSQQGFLYICEYLGVSPSEFWATDNENPIEMRELIENMKKLNEQQRFSISAIVKDLVNKQR